MKNHSAIALGVLLALAAPGLAKEKVKTATDLSGWMGNWTAGEEQQIAITPGAGGGLLLEGFATYGANDPERVQSGGVNEGSFFGTVPASWIANGKVAVAFSGDEVVRPDEAEDYVCVVEMELSGDMLEVSDNRMCGGLNVSFTGTYSQ